MASSLPVEYLGSFRLEIGARLVLENGPQGTRTIAHVTGGSFQGPRLKGTVEGPAGDWITNRADGTYRLDVRVTLRTDDGALVLVTYNGIAHATDTGSSIRTAPLFETGDPRYAWLNGVQAVGIGARECNVVTYEVYALS